MIPRGRARHEAERQPTDVENVAWTAGSEYSDRTGVLRENPLRRKYDSLGISSSLCRLVARRHRSGDRRGPVAPARQRIPALVTTAAGPGIPTPKRRLRRLPLPRSWGVCPAISGSALSFSPRRGRDCPSPRAPRWGHHPLPRGSAPRAQAPPKLQMSLRYVLTSLATRGAPTSASGLRHHRDSETSLDVPIPGFFQGSAGDLRSFDGSARHGVIRLSSILQDP
jgi:hypothetical protein